LLAAAIALTAAASAYATATLRGSAAADERVARTTLAAVRNPAGAPNRTLALARVTIPPGGRLAPAGRLGSQVAYVVRGRLSYRVVRGHVTVGRGTPDWRGDAPVRRQIVAPGQTTIRKGEWFDKGVGAVDRAVNEGEEPVEILFASLFANN
jgi:hypothetical protein